MENKKLEEQLNHLRDRYLAKNNDNVTSEEHIHAHMTSDEKVKRINEMFDLMNEKETLIKERLTQLQENDKDQKEDLKHHLEAISEKRALLEQKLEYIQEGEFDTAKKERLKRQLAELELKRCKLMLNKKDCSKIAQKIAQKKELFTKNN
ncbi:MAG: hypothetical protein FWF14_03230 [Streptococcaceae bacterium]|nr:hypothetical protein [Streptococcaceae bacterium]